MKHSKPSSELISRFFDDQKKQSSSWVTAAKLDVTHLKSGKQKDTK